MLEQELKENTAALRENTEALKQMNAGRDEALKALQEQAKGEGSSARKPRAAAKKEEPAAEPAEIAAGAAGEPSWWNPDISVVGMRGLVGDYIGQDADADAKTARTANVKAVLAHFGVDAVNPLDNKPTAKAIKGDDNRRQAAFFITRFANGVPVDFSADYDFNADPLAQGDLEPVAEQAAAEEEDFLG